MSEKDYPKVSDEDLHIFLCKHRRHSRYKAKGKESVQSIIKGHQDMLNRTGWDVISRHESYNGQIVKFDYRLFDVNADVEPVEYESNAGHLTHLLD